MLHAFPPHPLLCACERTEGKRGRKEGGGGTGVCRDQCMVHTDVSSRRQGCREENARVSGGREEREGGEGKV